MGQCLSATARSTTAPHQISVCDAPSPLQSQDSVNGASPPPHNLVNDPSSPLQSQDLLDVILPRLEPRDRIAAAAVCRQWRDQTKAFCTAAKSMNKRFAGAPLKHPPPPPTATRLAGKPLSEVPVGTKLTLRSPCGLSSVELNRIAADLWMYKADCPVANHPNPFYRHTLGGGLATEGDGALQDVAFGDCFGNEVFIFQLALPNEQVGLKLARGWFCHGGSGFFSIPKTKNILAFAHRETASEGVMAVAHVGGELRFYGDQSDADVSVQKPDGRAWRNPYITWSRDGSAVCVSDEDGLFAWNRQSLARLWPLEAT